MSYKKKENKQSELLLTDIPRDIFFYILDLIYLEYNNETPALDSNSRLYWMPIFTKKFRNLMLVNKKIKQWIIYYIKNKHNLFDFFENIDIDFKVKPWIISLANGNGFDSGWINWGSRWINRIMRINRPNHVDSLYFFLSVFEKVIKNPETLRKYPNILEKIRLSGIFLNNLYHKKIELKTKTPRETLNKIIENDIEFKIPYFCLNIFFDNTGIVLCEKILKKICMTINIFKIYSGIDIDFFQKKFMRTHKYDCGVLTYYCYEFSIRPSIGNYCFGMCIF